MFSDTHFHFHTTIDRGLDGTEILKALVERDTFFGLDIGTKPADLNPRKVQLEEAIAKLPEEYQKKARNMIYYSAGIWPGVDDIKNRSEALEELERQISEFMVAEKTSSFFEENKGKSHLVAIGECGLDHHWNPAGTDGRNEQDFDNEVYEGERELFQMQLELAKKLSLPVVIHSRDAFDETLDCIKNMGYHNGIIHCYSYGKSEARAFLDLGWHIAFGGGTTYTKKSRMDEMLELLKFVPDDRILMETDSPYLAPVPFRGQTNTPVLVEQCFNFVASARNITPRELSEITDRNIRNLFGI